MSVTAEQVVQAGVVGAGGAGFPTHVKLAAKADTVIINAAECEPLLHKDKEVLRSHSRSVLDGLSAAMSLTGAVQGIVGIKEKYHELIETLSPMLTGGLRIQPLPDAYPSGDEFVLVYEVLGRIIPPGGIPLHVGAVVMNVETAYNVSQAPRQPVVEKFVSVAGAVTSPCTLKVPIGVTLAECIAAAGGPTIEHPVLIVGGVMMGRIEDNPQALVEKTTGAVIVLPADHYVVRRHRRVWEHVVRIGRSACDQCSFCTELCPRYMLGHPIQPHRAMRSLGFNKVGQADFIGTLFCCECNLCSMYACPEDLDPRSVCQQNKRRLMGEGTKWADAPFSNGRAEILMKNRKAPTTRLMRKLGLTRFNNVGPLIEGLLDSRRVGIKLKQHVGAPCKAVVTVGQRVSRGQVVGERPVTDGKTALGAPVHASINGAVTAIAEGVVWIENGRR